jgi:hypothetical protein
MAATSLDMTWIAQDNFFRLRVQAITFQYAIVTIRGGTNQALKSYASQVLNNINGFINAFAWSCAQDQNLANAVIVANSNTNFGLAPAAGVVQTAVNTGATDTLIQNAVATAFPVLANS